MNAKCDFCESAAVYDGKTGLGCWAYMCNTHFVQLGVKVKGLYTVLNVEKQASEEVPRNETK